MTKFNINLGRGHVFTQRSRRKIYGVFFIYLLICGLLLIFMCNRAVSDLVFAHHQEERIRDLERRFRETHTLDLGIRDFHTATLNRLKKCEKQLALLDEKIERQQPISQLLVELIAPLPPGVSLHEAKYQKSDNLLQFSVIIPRGDNLEPVNSDQLIVRWKKRPGVRSLVQTITAVYSDRSIVHQREVYVVRFRCTLKEQV